MLSDHVRNHAEAEALFKKKGDARLEESRAQEEYQAKERAMREKTARLRALRLARDQAEQSASGDRARAARPQSGKRKRAARFPDTSENSPRPAQRTWNSQ